MKSKHTPGPWIAENEVSCIKIWSRSNGRTVLARVGSNDTDEANARLIAAAPELLRLLGLLVRDTWRNSTLELRHECERAIAKAEGRI